MTINTSFLYNSILTGASLLLLLLSLPSLMDYGILSFVALVPYFILVHHNRTELSKVIFFSILLGTLYIFIGAVPLLSLTTWWWVESVPVLSNLSSMREVVYYGYLFIVAFIAGGLLFGVFGWYFSRITNSRWYLYLLVPFVWILLEFLRELLPLGSWGHLGYSLHKLEVVVQTASILSVYGLSLLIVSINIGVFSVYKLVVGANQREPLYQIATVGVLVIFFVGYGHLAYTTRDAHFSDSRVVSVIQPNIDREQRQSYDVYDLYEPLLVEAVQKNATIILLPENAFPFLTYIEEEGVVEFYGTHEPTTSIWDRLLSLSRENPEVHFLIGAHTVKNDLTSNSLIRIRGGDVDVVYRKVALIPFSERRYSFMPDTPYFINPATDHAHFDIGGIRATARICSEVSYPFMFRDMETQLLFIPANENMFDSYGVHHYAFVKSKIRAVEARTYIMRSATNGISGIIDPYGVSLLDTAVTHDEVLIHEIPFY